MGEVQHTRHARIDYYNLFLDAARTSERRAEKLRARIAEVLENLADNPLMDGVVEDHMVDLRAFAKKDFVVFYRPTERGILVMRLAHPSAEITKTFFLDQSPEADPEAEEEE